MTISLPSDIKSSNAVRPLLARVRVSTYDRRKHNQAAAPVMASPVRTPINDAGILMRRFNLGRADSAHV